MESDEELFDAKSEKSKEASTKQPVVSEDEEDLFWTLNQNPIVTSVN